VRSANVGNTLFRNVGFWSKILPCHSRPWDQLMWAVRSFETSVFGIKYCLHIHDREIRKYRAVRAYETSSFGVSILPSHLRREILWCGQYSLSKRREPFLQWHCVTASLNVHCYCVVEMFHLIPIIFSSAYELVSFSNISFHMLLVQVLTMLFSSILNLCFSLRWKTQFIHTRKSLTCLF
jgi:hypothetical protein